MKMMPLLGYQTRSQDGTAEGGISTAQTAGVTQLSIDSTVDVKCIGGSDCIGLDDLTSHVLAGLRC